MAITAKRPPTPWLPTLTAILVVQTTVAYLSRIVPTLAPLVVAGLGLGGEAVGYLAAIGVVGSIVFLVAGTPFIRRFGPLRTLQAGLVLGLVGLTVMAVPHPLALAAGSFLVGVGYAPSAPAGNEVLHRFAPPAHRGLIFSIKQAGVPVGGVLAGLALPALAGRWGWTGALAGSAILVAAAVALVQPMRAATDVLRDPGVRVTPGYLLHLDNLTRPLATLSANPPLARLALCGLCLSVGQGVWLTFLVTQGVTRLGLDLASAGVLFAIMQATGIVGRILLGWIADRLGSGRRTLRATVVASALTSLVLAVASPAWPFPALCALVAVGGITVSSWNGVQLAEIAALSPPDRIAEASAGATIVVFVGFTLAPAAFAALLAVGGRWELGYALVAAVTAAGLLGLRRA